VDVTGRFAAAVQRSPVELDEVVLLVAAHAHRGLDVHGQRRRLDDLADRCAEPTVDGVVDLLFGAGGFAGNVAEYHDPRNSYLNDVLDRRTGIPITLSVLTMEVGRRVGVPFVGIGMPAHFIARAANDDTAFVDPFGGGTRLDPDGVRRRYRDVAGATAPWDDSFLEPTEPVAIVGRLLANLKAIFRSRGDRTQLEWVLRLRALVPGLPMSERRELASVLAASGRFGEAAAELEGAAAGLGDSAAARELLAAAVRLRSRLN
jgi:regulator of sirC expression with transglutaminase-like and TPR domain